MSHKSRPISTFIKNSQSKTTMKEIKKEDDEVSINPQENLVEMVNKVGGVN